MAVVGDVFGLNSVYAKQVENVENSNFKSWPENAEHGYWAGGQNISTANYECAISRLDFSTETALTYPGMLPVGMEQMASVTTNSYGYFGGGATPTSQYNVISRLDYSNDSVSLPGNNFSLLTYQHAGTTSDTYGYFVGGYQSNVRVCVITRLDFTTESLSLPGNGLPGLKSAFTAVASNSYSYFGGGVIPGSSPPGVTCVISRLDFSTETNSLPGKNLPSERYSAATISGKLSGYFTGGQVSTSVFNTISRLDFDTETNHLPGNNLVNGKGRHSTVSNGQFGYIVSGTPSSNSEIQKLDLNNEVVSSTPATVSGVEWSSGVQGGASLRSFTTKSYGYYFGGDKFLAPPPPQIVSTILRMDFSTGSYSNLGNSMPAQKSNISTVASNERSYGKWTNTQVIRFDFASEFSSLFTISNTPVSSGSKGNASNSNYGYWLNLSRIDYSNESVSTPITQSDNFSSGKSTSISASTLTTKYAYFAGGGNSSSNVHSAIHKLDFSNEVITKIDPILSSNKYAHTGITGVGYGYYGGGYSTPPPGGRNTIRKLDFSTEVVSPMPNLSVAAYNRGALSDDYYGYISGGFGPGPSNHSRVERIDFSNSTYTITTNLPMARDKHSGITNSISSS